MQKRSKRSEKKAPIGSTREKGDFVEAIVAELHKTKGISVERNVYLPTLDKSQRRREIDILLTGSLSGYPVQIAIECKNEEKPIGIEEIDEFIGKLIDIGIPLSLGVFVSKSGYKKGVAARANDAGIKPLIFEDLSKIGNTIQSALQSIIFLLATIEKFSIHNDVPYVKNDSGEMLVFRNKKGEIVGYVMDLIWDYWVNKKIPQTLGKHEININTIPRNWVQIVEGKIANVTKIIAEISVKAHIISFPGTISHYSLYNAITSKIEKFQIDTKFDFPIGTHKVYSFSQENDLNEYLNRINGFQIAVGRFPLPKIQYGVFYWPPSNKAILNIWNEYNKTIESGTEFDLTKYSLSDIEGTDLNSIWEPVWREHPYKKRNIK